MTAIASASILDDLTLTVTQEIRVKAPIDLTFASLLEQLGPYNETPDGTAMPMTLEPWPGGRWFRDLGDRNGHFWAAVQAIKRPRFLSSPARCSCRFPWLTTSNLASAKKVVSPLSGFGTQGSG